MKVKDQLLTDQYAIYNGDNMSVLPTLNENSIDLSVYSPPFLSHKGSGLYNYSSSEMDLSNCETKEQFLQQYAFIIAEIARVTKPGRISAVHVMEGINQNGSNFDFPHEVVKLHEKYGFQYKNRISIWKEPLKVRMRTMVMSLMHKFIVEDSTNCFTASPDYVLIFKKKGENQIPVTHPYGLKNYAGAIPILPNMLTAFNNVNKTKFNENQLWQYLNNEYYDSKEPNNKLSHYIWQRYASSTWDDIRIDEVLQYKEGSDEDDEKHIHPLQLDVVDRLVELYSNPNEIVLTPFMGIGTEVFSPVSQDRKALGIELKDSYFKQAIKNLKEVNLRFNKNTQQKLF